MSIRPIRTVDESIQERRCPRCGSIVAEIPGPTWIQVDGTWVQINVRHRCDDSAEPIRDGQGGR